MTRHEDALYLRHMLESAQKAMDFATGLSRQAFDADEMRQLATTRLLQIIGEAANKVSNEFQQQYPQIPWKQIIGMRHRLVHNYADVDQDVLWQTLQGDLPALAEVLKSIDASE